MGEVSLTGWESGAWDTVLVLLEPREPLSERWVFHRKAVNRLSYFPSVSESMSL